MKAQFFRSSAFISLLICLFFWSYECAEISATGDQSTSPGTGFYRTLAALEFGNDDVTAMFQDLTAASETVAGCSGNCRTPVSFWMLRSVEPCNNLIKAECPLGLVCCGDPQGKSTISTYGTPDLQDSSTFYIPIDDILKTREILSKGNAAIH